MDPGIYDDLLGVKISSTRPVEGRDALDVQGFVYFERARDCCSAASHISLTVLGREISVVLARSERNTQKVRHEVRNFVEKSFVLTEFDSEAPCTEPQIYKFSFLLDAAELPASLGCRDGPNRCSIEYEVIARLHLENEDVVVWSSAALLWGRPSAESLPPTAKRDCQAECPDIKLFFCIPKGSMKLMASIDKNVFTVDEAVKVSFVAENHSDVPVSKVEVVFHEMLKWKASGHDHCVKKEYVVTYCPKQLGCEDEVSMEEAEVSPLMPGDFRPSIQGYLISCRHAVSITLRTPFGYMNTTARLPIWIVRTTASAQPTIVTSYPPDKYSRKLRPSGIYCEPGALPPHWQDSEQARHAVKIPLGIVERDASSGGLRSVAEQVTTTSGAGMTAGLGEEVSCLRSCSLVVMLICLITGIYWVVVSKAASGWILCACGLVIMVISLTFTHRLRMESEIDGVRAAISDSAAMSIPLDSNHAELA